MNATMTNLAQIFTWTEKQHFEFFFKTTQQLKQGKKIWETTDQSFIPFD